MRFIIVILTLAALIGCSGAPANRPTIAKFQPSQYNAVTLEYENNSFLPSVQSDGSVVVSRRSGINFRIMPMTSGRTKGAAIPDAELNELIRQNEELLRSDPQNYDACITLAGLYNDRNRPGDANQTIRYSNMALEINKDDPQAIFARGLGYNELGDNARALSDMNSVMRLNVQSVKSAAYIMGMIYYRENRVNEAIDAFELVTAIDPGFIDTSEILRVLYSRR
ncbi:MAG: hypothetical protein FWD26_09025 [Treponema sp.]|nr:hypothetical protein [Treponema sp.]